ncbi:hypothetical protein FN846DRAFT_675514 [Sphaerosporella brunnea]|uniref:Uncharacterized protein n=1 Tax=Sphaerosporella brunnea TaxID=1250544 RepID=A0A5J5F9S4_9PEZI|nr:hypothetical protein FN846DRAFT_675514 [Sphaerosporella brunnea]
MRGRWLAGLAGWLGWLVVCSLWLWGRQKALRVSRLHSHRDAAGPDVFHLSVRICTSNSFPFWGVGTAEETRRLVDDDVRCGQMQPACRKILREVKSSSKSQPGSQTDQPPRLRAKKIHVPPFSSSPTLLCCFASTPSGSLLRPALELMLW